MTNEINDPFQVMQGLAHYSQEHKGYDPRGTSYSRGLGVQPINEIHWVISMSLYIEKLMELNPSLEAPSLPNENPFE